MLDAHGPTPRHCDPLGGSRPGATPCDPTCPSRYRAAAGGRVDGRPVKTTPGALAPPPDPLDDGDGAELGDTWLRTHEPPAVCEACKVRLTPGACLGTERCPTVAMVEEAKVRA